MTSRTRSVRWISSFFVYLLLLISTSTCLTGGFEANAAEGSGPQPAESEHPTPPVPASNLAQPANEIAGDASARKNATTRPYLVALRTLDFPESADPVSRRLILKELSRPVLYTQLNRVFPQNTIKGHADLLEISIVDMTEQDAEGLATSNKDLIVVEDKSMGSAPFELFAKRSLGSNKPFESEFAEHLTTCKIPQSRAEFHTNGEGVTIAVLGQADSRDTLMVMNVLIEIVPKAQIKKIFFPEEVITVGKLILAMDVALSAGADIILVPIAKVIKPSATKEVDALVLWQRAVHLAAAQGVPVVLPVGDLRINDKGISELAYAEGAFIVGGTAAPIGDQEISIADFSALSNDVNQLVAVADVVTFLQTTEDKVEYFQAKGTAVAAAQVAGVLALVRSGPGGELLTTKELRETVIDQSNDSNVAQPSDDKDFRMLDAYAVIEDVARDQPQDRPRIEVRQDSSNKNLSRFRARNALWQNFFERYGFVVDTEESGK